MDRREFLSWVQGGLAGAAAATLLLRDGDSAVVLSPARRRPPCPHFAPRAKRAIHVCLCGAMSQIDTFDYKPGLIAAHGKPVNSSTKPDTFFGKIGRLRKPDWAFRKRGASGLWVSDLFPCLAEVADELTVIRSMQAETSNHTPATFHENSGFRLNGFPCAGAWLSYGLGSESDDLPAFVVIPDAREFPAGGAINWTNGFLPARHQGVVIRPQGEPIDDLFPAIPVRSESEAGTRELVAAMNRSHIARHPGDDTLAARIRGYEMAARMQVSVPLVADLKDENQETLSLYGVDRKECTDFGRACLLAQRCSSAASVLCRSIPAERLAARGETGMATRTCGRTTDWRQAVSTAHSPGCCAISAAAACSMTRWFWSRPSLAGRRFPNPEPTRWAWAAITTRKAFAYGSPAPGSSMEWLTDQPTRSAGKPPRTSSPGPTFTRRCCTCWGSTTSG